MNSKPKIVIIGAGLQGLCVALALAEHGVDSTVIERRPSPMRGASYGNEGKIHLGLVYALDTTFQTGIEMLKGALSFSPLLDRWCGILPWHEWISSGFRYSVMPGSLATPATLETYYENLRLRIEETAGALAFQPSYFGKMPSWMWKRATVTAGSPIIDGIPAPSFVTEEVAIDTNLFSAALVERVRQKRGITLRSNTRVAAVERRGSTFKLSLESQEGSGTIEAHTVINCSWSDRVRLDRMIYAAKNETPLSYRIKHRVIVRPRHGVGNLVPLTMVQGPYGDVAPYKDGTVYLSWYPECRTFFGEKPPAEEFRNPLVLNEISSRTVNIMSSMFPELANAEVLSCSPCIIVAEGTRDVDDPRSELHHRTHTGPHGGNNWWSVDTGKLTLAPLHGHTTARLVIDELGLGK